jgi:Galactosyltransferase.
MTRVNRRHLTFAFLVFFVIAIVRYNFGYAPSKEHTSITSYIISAQERLLQRFESHHLKNISRPARLNHTSTNEMLDFVKMVHKQMTYMNKTLQRLSSWTDYQQYRKNLEKSFLISDPTKHSKLNPHVLLDNVKLDCSKNYEIIFLVTSFAKNFERREWIRESWGKENAWSLKGNWKIVFNVGIVKVDAATTNKKLREESEKYGDLLLVDIPEDFHKLSEKVMVALHWIYQKFNFSFILKTDDDIFIHIDRTLTIVRSDWKNENFVGHAMRGQPPERGKGRYGVSKEEWAGKTYDAYCSGGGYLLSQAIIGKSIINF